MLPPEFGANVVLEQFTDSDGLKRLNGAASRAVRVLASVVQTGSTRNIDEPHKIVAHLAAKKAYEQAGVAPEDVDVAEVHDATAMGEFLNAESLMRSLFVQARKMVPRAH